MKFVEALNEIVDERELVLERCRGLYESFLDTSALDDEIADHIRECEILAELSRKLVEENARQERDQDEFMKRYDSYTSKYDAQMEKVEQLKALRAERLQKAEAVSAFMFEIHEQECFIEDFNEKLWLMTIENATVCHDGKMVFRFKNGMEVTKESLNKSPTLQANPQKFEECARNRAIQRYNLSIFASFSPQWA